MILLARAKQLDAFCQNLKGVAYEIKRFFMEERDFACQGEQNQSLLSKNGLLEELIDFPREQLICCLPGQPKYVLLIDNVWFA